MKKNSIKKKKIRKDCWSLDYAFLVWLKERLPVYYKDASQFIDLKFHKFELDGKILTQEEVIKQMIQDVNYLTSKIVDDWSDEYNKTYNRLLTYWKETSRSMWW